MPKSPVFLLFCCFFFSPLYRIKLKKAKSIREKMREAGVLEQYLKKIKYDPVKKYNFSNDYVVNEPITNHLDVSSPLSRCLSVCTSYSPLPPLSQLLEQSSPLTLQSERLFFSPHSFLSFSFRL